jgi:hypothetical protein
MGSNDIGRQRDIAEKLQWLLDNDRELGFFLIDTVGRMHDALSIADPIEQRAVNDAELAILGAVFDLRRSNRSGSLADIIDTVRRQQRGEG